MTMKIQKVGVIADTHLIQSTRELEALVQGPFRDVEAILHAGDITEMAVLDAFAGKEIVAVCGNMDSSGVRMHLPSKRVWKAGRFTIGLIHGWGGRGEIEERIRGEFDGVDGIVYGHTHIPAQGEKYGVFFFNPGSFAGIFGNGKKSVGLLELGESISGSFCYL
jgi:uncharacterized protein